MHGFHQAVHSSDVDGYAIFHRKALPYFIGAEAFAGFGVQFRNGGADFLVFQRMRSRGMVEMLVIGAAADAKDTAEDTDVVLKPQEWTAFNRCLSVA